MAPAIGAPAFCHWYLSVVPTPPSATTVNVWLSPVLLVTPSGWVLISGKIVVVPVVVMVTDLRFIVLARLAVARQPIENPSKTFVSVVVLATVCV